MVQREQDIVESLRILFVTRKGERVMHPDFGCSLHDLVFEPMDSHTTNAIQQAIRQAILFFEARIDVDEVTVETADWLEGRLAVKLVYTVRATNSRHNVVFPFYFAEGTLLSGVPTEAEL